MLGWMRVFGACGVVAIVVLFLGSAFSAGDVSRLSLAESSDLWGAGGVCTGSKAGTTWGCNTPPCTAVKNMVTTTGTDSKIVTLICFVEYPGGGKVYCGPATVANKCSK